MIPIIYILEVRPNCEKLKAALKDAGIECKERDMQTRDSMVDLRCRACFAREAPVLMTDRNEYKAGKSLTEERGLNLICWFIF